MGTFHGSPSPIPVKTRLKVDALSDCHNLAQFGPGSSGSPLDSSIHNHHDLPVPYPLSALVPHPR